jgi:hypothetical protein
MADSAPIQSVELYERQHQHVRQRQPHGADLLVAGRPAIEDASDDALVRLAVAVPQRPAVPGDKGERQSAGGDQEQRRQRLKMR